MNSKVILLECSSYDDELVYEKLSKGLDLLGGIENLISPEEKVLLKLNLVRGAMPMEAVTTHPAIVAALCRILNEKGYADIKAGDSCGFGNAKAVMHGLELDPVFEKYGVKTCSFDEAAHVDFPEGVHAKKFTLAKDVLDADALISLPKMKTHALEYITGAVKNQYGCVCGINKAKGHTMYPSQESFAKMLVDLDLCIRPRLYILDGVMAMEGNGPTGGDPVPMNLIMISTDPVAIDTIFAKLVYLDINTVPTIVFGDKFGLGTCRDEKIEILSDNGAISMSEAVSRFGRPSFNVIREKHKSKGWMGFVTKLNRFKSKPKLDASKCRKCGICVESCPVEGKAISFKNGRENPPVYDYKKCIRCFCCQEMCPHKAISVKGR